MVYVQHVLLLKEKSFFSNKVLKVSATVGTLLPPRFQVQRGKNSSPFTKLTDQIQLLQHHLQRKQLLIFKGFLGKIVKNEMKK